jgi:catechol 2,3-dioxygenase-like lactoylglutathione lyase family enzyme
MAPHRERSDMIHALDHIVLAAPSPEAAAAECQTLLGRRPEGASFQLANMRLELQASGSASPGLSALVFAVRDIGKARHLLGQRALPLAEPDADATGAAPLLRIAAAATHQVPIALVQRDAPEPPSPPAAEEAAAVAGLDHVVIRSPDPERAVALYAGRLGLSLRLDRSEPAWGARLLFFRCGDLIVEVAHDLRVGVSGGPDRLWGLSWRLPDLAGAHARLSSAGVDVSDMRAGRRPGTKVFTVRSHSAGVPTLMLGAA